MPKPSPMLNLGLARLPATPDQACRVGRADPGWRRGPTTPGPNPQAGFAAGRRGCVVSPFTRGGQVQIFARLPLLLTVPEHSNFWKPPETLTQGGSRNPRNYPLTGGINLLFAAAVPRHSRELDTRKLAHKASKTTPQKFSQSRPPYPAVSPRRLLAAAESAIGSP